MEENCINEKLKELCEAQAKSQWDGSEWAGRKPYCGLVGGIEQPDPHLRPQIAQRIQTPPKAPILERLDWLEERMNNSENVTRKMFDEVLDRLSKLETMVRG